MTRLLDGMGIPARGENVLAEKTEAEDAAIAAEELFEEGAGPKAEAEEEAAEA